MSRQSTIHHQPSMMQRLVRRFTPVGSAFFATLLALPVGAVSIPDNPLQSGAAYPPPNIRFILDDSGSMTYVAMPDDDQNMSDLGNHIFDRSYVHNTIFYNPSVDYKTWLYADGSRLTGGTSYSAAFSSDNLASGSTMDLSNSTQVFFFPKDPAAIESGAADRNDPVNYDRYEIRQVAGTTRVVKAGASASASWNNRDIDEREWWRGTFVVPTGMTSLVITTRNNPDFRDDVDLYVRLGSAPTLTAYDNSSITNGDSNETITIANPAAGTWHIGAYNKASGSGNREADNVDIAAFATSDVITTPTGRTEAAELTNFATWYSYFRTRMKVAKSGASEAFAALGSNLRVGFDTIWNRNEYPIPVGSNNGLFSGSNRTTWFDRLHAATGSNSTPLKGALFRAGESFKNTSATGPWGPETGANQISCRQNFAILTTDGYWNDAFGYTTPVGDADNQSGPTITGPGGQTHTYTPVRPYIDNFATSPNTRPDTLADVAMHYWKNDLVPSLTNNVPAGVSDPAFWQHMVTFSISIGLQGRLNPATDLPAITNGSKHWGDPIPDPEDEDRIDDLWHAAVNGHGSFVAASSPTKFAQALSDALALIAARRGSASNVATNSTSFQSDTKVFQARYWSGRWTGELAAYAATSAGVATEPAWQASQLIPAVGSRQVFTWTGSAGATFPTSGQTTALDQSARALAPATGAENAAYLKGDTTKERRNGGNLRNREITIREGGADVVKPTVLGDIVNSSPIYIEEIDTLFVGGNDGMLHAFDASTGVERFGYVPAGINFSQLATLSDPNYVHRYFVDGPLAVSTTNQTPGKNYLIGALGRGGKGLYALDVTDIDTTSFASGDVLWERTSGANMGQVLGEPLLVTLNNGSKGVIVGNGINSSSGNAVLFILDITNGNILAEIDTGSGGDNGMFAPRGWDDNGDGTVDYVYGGDRNGNLWRFDLTSVNPADWDDAGNRVALYRAVDDNGLAQPITAGLALAREPNTGKRWIFIGTGSYLTTADSINFDDVQSMYGIVDNNSGTTVIGRTASGNGDLTERAIIEVGTFGGRRVRGFQANGTLPSGSKGWYIDLESDSDGDGDNTEGERIVSNPRIRGTVLLTASMIPPVVNTCDAGGRGFINALDAFTGTSLSEPFFNVNGNGTADNPDFSDDVIGSTPVAIGSVDLGVGMPTLPTIIDKLLVVGGSSGTIGSIGVNPQGGGARRISWREILRD